MTWHRERNILKGARKLAVCLPTVRSGQSESDREREARVRERERTRVGEGEGGDREGGREG